MRRLQTSTRRLRSSTRSIGIGQIGQQREMQMEIAVGQVADFQIQRQAVNLGLREQQGRNRHQRNAIGGNAFGEIQLGQRARRQQEGNQVIHEIHGRLGRRQQQQQQGREDRCQRADPCQQPHHDQECDQLDARSGRREPGGPPPCG